MGEIHMRHVWEDGGHSRDFADENAQGWWLHLMNGMFHVIHCNTLLAGCVIEA